MNKKRIGLLLCACATLTAVSAIAASQLNLGDGVVLDAEESVYHFLLDANNNKLTVDIASKDAKSVFTTSKNKLTAVYSKASVKDGYWCSLSDGGYFYINGLLHGLKKITVVYEGEGKLMVHGGADKEQLSCAYPDVVLSHFEDIASGTAYSFENGMGTFELKASGAVDVKSVDVEYSCIDNDDEASYGVIENTNGHVVMNSTSGVQGLSRLALSDVGVGNEVEISFTGKNLPNVVAFSDRDGGKVFGNDSAEGVALMTSGVVNATDANHTRMMPYGPYRLDTVNNALGSTVYRRPSYAISNCGYGSLNDTHEYKYKIYLGSFTDTTVCHINVSLVDVTSNTTLSKEVTFDTATNGGGTAIDDPEIYNNTKFLIYGQSEKIEFDYKVTKKTMQVAEAYKASFDLTTNTLKFTAKAADNTYPDTPYLDFGEYESGGYVGMEFTGKYKPQIAFFTDGGHKSLVSDADKCFFWSDDFVGVDYRVYKNTAKATTVADQAEMKKACYNVLDANTTYFLAISTKKSSETKYQLTYNFYTVSGSTLTKVASQTLERSTTDVPDVSGNHIVAYGSRITNLTAKVYIADTLSEVLANYTVAE